MPDRVFAFPFSIGPNGSVATVEHESDAEYDQLIAVACLTVQGERELVKTFGVADPAFVGFEVANLTRHVQDFGPPVAVDGVALRPTQDGRETVTITWTREQM